MSVSNAVTLSSHDQILSAQLLQEAFQRFNEASVRLEDKHQALLAEVAGLKIQVAEKEREIQRAARLAMLGETAAAIAHEVRNPLGAIQLFLSLLRQDVQALPGALKLVDQIDTSIGSLNHAVSNILHFSSDKPLLLAPVNLHSIVQDQVRECSGMLQNTGVILLDLKSGPFVLGEEHALRQLVRNLLRNAQQATRFEGTIAVSTREDGSSFILEVRDSGPGIKEEIIDTLFDPFVTGRPEGTGLGLAIVKRIVEQHGATVRAFNDGGAVFEVRFPRSGADLGGK